LPLPQTMGYTGPGWRENECRQSCPSDKCLVCDELDFGCDGDCGSCPTFEERVEIRWVTKERTLINLAGHIPNCSLEICKISTPTLRPSGRPSLNRPSGYWKSVCKLR
jgi:hypothetical protein